MGRIAGLAGVAPVRQPGVQPGAPLLAGETLVVGQIVGLAHERIDGADGIAPGRGQRHKGIVEVLGLAPGNRTAMRIGRGHRRPTRRASIRRASAQWIFASQSVFSVRGARPRRRRNGSSLAAAAHSPSLALVLFDMAGRALSTS